MADSATIGAEFSSYQGNAGLGEVGGGAFKIDTNPLRDLAAYANLYNQHVWRQRQADTDAKVKQLADLSDIHLNDLRGKDREFMSKRWTEFLSYASDFATKEPKTQDEKLKQQLEWQTKFGAFINDFDSGKQRALSYQAHKNIILNNTTDPKLQEVQLAQLDRVFDETDITTPISALPQYKMQDIDIPKPVTQKFDVVDIGGDQNIATDATVFNPALNISNADAAILGIKKVYPQKGTPEYENLSQNEKDAAEQQSTFQSNAKIWNDMNTPLNQAIQKYVDENGNFDATKFEDDNAANTTLMRPYNALKALDTYSQTKYSQAVNGQLDDKGLSFKTLSAVNPTDFKSGFVDFGKGISPNQLALAGIFSQYGGDSFEKKVTETGKATQLKLANISATTQRRGQDLDYKLGQDRIKADKEKWKSSQTGGETVKNGAFQRAQRIYSDLEKLADKNGIITPDKIRQLNAEQLKYMGVEKVETSENGVARTVYQPLNLSGKNAQGEKENEDFNGNFAIILDKGKINVLANAQPDKSKPGHFVGRLDNTKSTNLFNIGTNILNEELSKAGSKELNSYLPVDSGEGVQSTTTTGGSQTQSGSVSTNQSFVIKGKPYTKEQLNAMGYTDEQINQAIQLGNIKTK